MSFKCNVCAEFQNVKPCSGLPKVTAGPLRVKEFTLNSCRINQFVNCWLLTGRWGGGGSDPRKYFSVPFAIRPPSRASAMFSSASVIIVRGPG
jgi:hypothetical protein